MTDQGGQPTEALDYYLWLGPSRTYQAVARHMKVSKRTVSRWAKVERWQARVRRLEEAARAKAALSGEDTLAEVEARHLERFLGLQGAFDGIMTEKRVEVLVAAAFAHAVKDQNVGAMRMLLDRTLGKIRSAPLPPTVLDIPDGLDDAGDVKAALNTLMQAVSDGSLSPEDAQRAATIVEAARKIIETEDLAKRLAALEKELESRKGGRP